MSNNKPLIEFTVLTLSSDGWRCCSSRRCWGGGVDESAEETSSLRCSLLGQLSSPRNSSWNVSIVHCPQYQNITKVLRDQPSHCYGNTHSQSLPFPAEKVFYMGGFTVFFPKSYGWKTRNSELVKWLMGVRTGEYGSWVSFWTLSVFTYFPCG